MIQVELFAQRETPTNPIPQIVGRKRGAVAALPQENSYLFIGGNAFFVLRVEIELNAERVGITLHSNKYTNDELKRMGFTSRVMRGSS